MKSILSTGIFAALIGWITTDNVGAFVGVRRYSNPTPIAERLTLAAAASVALEPEPLGGKELTCRTSIADCRLKQLNTPSTVKTDGSYQFWLTAKAEGKLIEEIRATILRDASKKANFPGFRKVISSPHSTQNAIYLYYRNHLYQARSSSFVLCNRQSRP